MILVTNDDGIDSPGIKALAFAMAEVDEIRVVAPDRERSAVSHALTLHAPLRVDERKPGWYSVSGTPADCVHLALKALLKEEPWLVVSGINKGANLGDDVIYSGTVAGAVEGVVHGCQGFAISLAARADFDFAPAASFARKVAIYLQAKPMPRNTLLNINVPAKADIDPKWRLTNQGQRVYKTKVVMREDPRGQPYYWIGGQEPGRIEETGTDLDAVDKGFVSVTPLHLDMTAYSLIEEFNRARAGRKR